MERRGVIIGTFLTVCLCAVAAETASLALLGSEAGDSFDGLLAGLTLALGVSCQIVFQGPRPTEIMDLMRRRSGYGSCAIDRVYMRFNLGRTVRLTIVLALWSILGIMGTSLRLLSYQELWAFVSIALCLATAAATRARVLSGRVSAGRFGTTEYEARELLRFLTKMHDSSQAGFDPPGKLRSHHE